MIWRTRALDGGERLEGCLNNGIEEDDSKVCEGGLCVDKMITWLLIARARGRKSRNEAGTPLQFCHGRRALKIGHSFASEKLEFGVLSHGLVGVLSHGLVGVLSEAHRGKRKNNKQEMQAQSPARTLILSQTLYLLRTRAELKKEKRRITSYC